MGDEACVICTEPFTDPVTLPCQPQPHTFCRTCILEWWRKHLARCIRKCQSETQEFYFNPTTGLFELRAVEPTPTDDDTTLDDCDKVNCETPRAAGAPNQVAVSGASAVQVSACTDSVESVLKRCSFDLEDCQPRDKSRCKGMLHCLTELIDSEIMPLRDLAQFFWCWTPHAVISKATLKSFRRTLLHAT